MDNKKADTFVQFPHELYDAVLRQRLTISQEKALLYIIRKTVGFHKRSDRISISRMASETGFRRRTMISAVHDLEKLAIIRLGETKSGRATEMELLPVDYWDKPVNAHSHVNGDAHVNGDSHQPVNAHSQGGVNGDSQVPVNGRSHTKETNKHIKEKERKETHPPIFEVKRPELEPGDEYDDEGWEDP